MDGAAVVVGAGAIGIVLADALATAGLRVTVLGGRPVRRLVLEDGGERRDHAVEHLPAWDGRRHDGPVVVAVKAQGTAAAGPLIAAAAAGAAALVVAQNGVEHA
ncbi:2-dehydropantoate 2-reductase N-terminal domain-containing protein, partial [Amnibacterium endophyticum]